MHDDRIGGWALIGGTLLSLVTMAMHPTGADLLRDHDTFAPRVVTAHGIALAALPLMFLGALTLRRRLAASGAPDAADGGLVLHGFASVAVLIAAVASGLLAPMVAGRILRADGAEAEMARALFAYNGMLNHGFATIYVAATALAMGVWSLAVLRTRALARGLAWLGLLVGGALVAITLLGRLRLDVHHFGMIVVAQGAWFVWAGAGLLKRRTPAA